MRQDNGKDDSQMEEEEEEEGGGGGGGRRVGGEGDHERTVLNPLSNNFISLLTNMKNLNITNTIFLISSTFLTVLLLQYTFKWASSPSSCVSCYLNSPKEREDKTFYSICGCCLLHDVNEALLMFLFYLLVVFLPRSEKLQ